MIVGVRHFGVGVAAAVSDPGPSQALRMGSRAVTRPLGGTLTSIDFRSSGECRAPGWDTTNKASAVSGLNLNGQAIGCPERFTRFA